MSITDDQYAAAAAAIKKIADANIAQNVPAIFQSQIPSDLVDRFCQDAARAALDSYSPSNQES